MGMFDEMVVHRKLPIPKEFQQDLKNVPWKETVFQTKDLENCLLNYKLSVNGYLYVQKFEDAGHLMAYNSFFDSGKNDNEMFWDKVLQPPLGINFYTGIQKESFDYWVEFNATFNKQGKLIQIEPRNFQKEDNTERKESEKKWKEERQRHEKIQKTFLYKAYNMFWKKPLMFLFRKMYSNAQKIPNIIIKIERKLFPW